MDKGDLGDLQDVQEQEDDSLDDQDNLLIRNVDNRPFLDRDDLFLVLSLEQYIVPLLKNRDLFSSWSLFLFCVHSHFLQSVHPRYEDHFCVIYQKHLATALQFVLFLTCLLHLAHLT